MPSNIHRLHINTEEISVTGPLLLYVLPPHVPRTSLSARTPNAGRLFASRSVRAYGERKAVCDGVAELALIHDVDVRIACRAHAQLGERPGVHLTVHGMREWGDEGGVLPPFLPPFLPFAAAFAFAIPLMALVLVPYSPDWSRATAACCSSESGRSVIIPVWQPMMACQVEG